jgi:hypothetical protein
VEGEASGAFIKDQNAAINERALSGETTRRIDDRSKQSISIHLSQPHRKHQAINGTKDTAPTILAGDIALTRQSHTSSLSTSSSLSIDNQRSSMGTAKIDRPGGNNAYLPPDPGCLNLSFDQRTPDECGQHVLPAKDGDFLVGNVTSIQADPSPPPRVNSVDMRTRLLARLELEKSQAPGVWPTDVEGHSIKSPQRASATSEIAQAQNDGGPSVDISTNEGAAHDIRVSDLPSARETSASESLSIKSHKRGQGDPDSVSVSVAEEARAREAKLRARAQLRIRLAAEKRRADAGWL